MSRSDRMCKRKSAHDAAQNKSIHAIFQDLMLIYWKALLNTCLREQHHEYDMGREDRNWLKFRRGDQELIWMHNLRNAILCIILGVSKTSIGGVQYKHFMEVWP